MTLKFSVVIPTKNAETTIEDCLRSVFSNKDIEEVIIVDDSTDRTKEIVSKYPVKLIKAPRKKISEKCNLGVENSHGDIIAFTDQDCVVPSDWIEKARRHIQKTGVHALGGPNLAPPKSGFRQRCASQLLSSWFGTGPSAYRYKIVSPTDKAFTVDESKLTSCNLFLDRKAVLEAGKFDPRLYSCEENELLYRMKERKFKLNYLPTLYVWHHRRPILMPLLKAIFWYANGRGFFLRRHPKSLQLFYLLPSAFVLGLFLGPIIISFLPILKIIYLSALGLYFTLTMLFSAKDALALNRRLKTFLILGVSYFLVHLTYGLGLIYGYMGRWYKYKTMNEQTSSNIIGHDKQRARV